MPRYLIITNTVIVLVIAAVVSFQVFFVESKSNTKKESESKTTVSIALQPTTTTTDPMDDSKFASMNLLLSAIQAIGLSMSSQIDNFDYFSIAPGGPRHEELKLQDPTIVWENSLLNSRSKPNSVGFIMTSSELIQLQSIDVNANLCFFIEITSDQNFRYGTGPIDPITDYCFDEPGKPTGNQFNSDDVAGWQSELTEMP